MNEVAAKVIFADKSEVTIYKDGLCQIVGNGHHDYKSKRFIYRKGTAIKELTDTLKELVG